MKTPPRTCLYCNHFRNSPAYLENVFKGLNTMSSGHASVRKDDGICQVHDIYLSAHNSCDRYEAASAAKGASGADV